MSIQAYKICRDLKEDHRLNSFIHKVKACIQKQLKWLRIKIDCIEDCLDGIVTLEKFRGMEQKNYNNCKKSKTLCWKDMSKKKNKNCDPGGAILTSWAKSSLLEMKNKYRQHGTFQGLTFFARESLQILHSYYRRACENDEEEAEARARAFNHAKDAKRAVKEVPFPSGTVRIKENAPKLECLLNIDSNLTLTSPWVKNF
jgi:hypothetical protein